MQGKRRPRLEVPKGFLRFFVNGSEVPEPPPGPPDEMLVEVKSTTIVYHCASAMSEDIGTIISSEKLDNIETRSSTLFKDIAPSISKEFNLDRRIYSPSGRNFRLLMYGPLKITVYAEPDLKLKGTAYFMMTFYDSQIVVASLVLPIETGGEFDLSSERPLTTESVRKLVRIYLEDIKCFTFNGEAIGPSKFLKGLLSMFTSTHSGFSDVEDWIFRRLTVYIWETDPDFKGKTLNFARSHAYECLAMVGEEEDWRMKTPENLIEYVPYVMSSSPNDCEIPCAMVSLIFSGAPIYKDVYYRWGLGPYALLDSHLAAAAAAFKASWRLTDVELLRVVDLRDDEYIRARKRLVRLYFRHRLLKNRFYNTNHFWTDSDYRELINAALGQLDYTERLRIEELEKNAESLNTQADRLSQAISQRRELDVNRALGFFSGLLGVSLWIELVPMIIEASIISASMKPLISITGALVIIVTIGIIFFKRD